MTWDHSVVRVAATDPDLLSLALQAARERAAVLGIVVRVEGPWGGVLVEIMPPEKTSKVTSRHH